MPANTKTNEQTIIDTKLESEQTPAHTPNKQTMARNQKWSRCQPISPTNKQTGTQNKIQEIRAESP
jgi:hypothetical protein